ncbi:MAG: hypothetical protein HYX27_11290 [Acidobacteria bacterium]|nr:hypothetical protein [Acidobacteriota bacterium]
MRNLLQFLAKVATEEPGHHVKEYEIATQVLGRAPDFDSRVDSTVRVHIGRLRAKLAEYYLTMGASDAVQVKIPKGTYSVICEHRAAWTEAAPLSAETPPSIEASPIQRHDWRWMLGWGVALAAAAMAAFTWIDRPPPAPAALRTFWTAFGRGGSGVTVVFSNPRFAGSAGQGLRYVPADEDLPPRAVNDRYTGVGEAFALHQLTRQLDELRMPLRVKRSQLLTWDEARSQNLVFLGGAEVNVPQGELPHLQAFDFKMTDNEPRRGLGAVVNLQKGEGEEPFYFNSGAPYTFDYAVIGLVAGLEPHRRALILAGTTTFGTQGAADYVLREETVSELLTKLGVRKDEPLPFFEALVRVKVSGGVPTQTNLVLLRRLK